MKLKDFQIYSYKTPTRETLIVRLIDETGNEGAGEIAPLPGRSHETYDEALTYVKELRKKFLLGDFTPTLFPPSVMFGMEMALRTLLFPPNEEIRFNLYTNKLKLKDLSVHDAIKLCKSKKGPLRIDLNRSWSLAKTVEFCSHFEKSDFLYIEEPVTNFTDLEKFYDQTGFSYAVDEHLALHPLERILPLRGLTHLIVKPTLFGGLTHCKAITDAAKNLTVVFSSTYESSLALMHIAHIASILTPNEPIGIDTADLFKNPLTPFNPKDTLISKELYLNPQINWSKLDRIY